MRYSQTFIFDKSTRGTHVYTNKDFPGIYIPKRLFTEAPPSQLTITIEDPINPKSEPDRLSAVEAAIEGAK